MLDDDEALAGVRIDDFLDDYFRRRRFRNNRLFDDNFLSNDRNIDYGFI
jgi:hypothetical protein